MCLHSQSLRWMSIHLYFHCGGKQSGGLPDACLFSHVVSVCINLRPASGKKTGKQQGCRWGPQNKPETRVLPKRTLSSNMFLPNPLPVLLQRVPAPAHLLLVIGVQGHLLYDLWWQWSSGARLWCVHRKLFDILMRPLPSPSRLKCDGLLQQLTPSKVQL